MQDFDAYLEQSLSGANKLDGLAREMLSAGGKRLRAKMTLRVAEDLGLSREIAFPWAAANELLHNASLVHDDIQDEDLYRRGQPTAWSAHGTGVAISLGDYLLMKPFLLTQQIPVAGEVRLKLGQWMAETVERMAVAQVEEGDLLKLRDGLQLRAAYVSVARGKTASLFELPIAGLALLAALDSEEQERWVAAFGVLGLVFQILDDLKDILGLKGKPSQGEDLREGKVSAVVVAYLQKRPHETEELLSFLSSEEREQKASAWLERIMQSEAISQTQEWLCNEWQVFESHLPLSMKNRGFAESLYGWFELDEALNWRKT